MLKINQLTLTRGAKELLVNATCTIPSTSRVGIIGRNGSGKSSFFKVMQGELDADSGSVDLPSGWKVGVLEQDLPSPTGTVIDTACSGDSEWQDTIAKLRIAEDKGDAHMIAHCHERLEAIDGYRIEGRASLICRGLGFSLEELTKPVGEFSGGWQMRVQLARVLLSRADLLLLDEPTNHLDLESALWLESWLQSYRGVALVISHDRDFLDATTTHTLHLSQQRLKLYAGGYSQFAKQLQEQLLLQEKMQKKVAAKRAHMQSFVDRFRAKASKAKQAQGRLKALSKLQYSAELEGEGSFSFSFYPCDKIPYPTVSVMGDMGYGEKTILSKVSFNIGAGDRLGVVGANGSGKTTFLKTLCGELSLLRGDLVAQKKAKVGYYSQQQVESLDLQATPIEQMRNLDAKISESEARKYLGGFAFSNDRVFEKIHHFSGGEKARLALAILVWTRPNILILDEPTNHLDMAMRDALIVALQDFSGAVLIVSHDRYLLTSCVDELVLVHNRSVKRIDGDMAAYQKMVLDEKKESKATNKAAAPTKTSNKSRVQARKECAKLEREIATMEKRLKQIDAKLAESDIYEEHNSQLMSETQNERLKLEKAIAAKQDLWLKNCSEL